MFEGSLREFLGVCGSWKDFLELKCAHDSSESLCNLQSGCSVIQ